MGWKFVLALLCPIIATTTFSGQEAKPFAKLELQGKDRFITSMAFSVDGKVFAACHCWSLGPCSVTLWDTVTGKRLRKIDCPIGAVASTPPLVFSPNGRWLAAGGIGEILLLDPEKGQKKHQMSVPDQIVLGLAFDSTSSQLASCGFGKDVLLWDVMTGKMKATLPFDHPFVFAVAFSANGKTITAVGSDDGNFSNWVVQVWDASTRKVIRMLAGKDKESFEMPRLSKDGCLLVVRKADVIELWDTVSGKQTGSIKSRGKEWAVLFSLTGDSKGIVTLNLREKKDGSFEGQLDLWHGGSGKHLASREVTSEEIEKGFGPKFVMASGGDLAAFQVEENEIALWRTKALLRELAERKD